MSKLDDVIYEKIKTLSHQGDLQMDSGEYVKSFESFVEAWNILPEPKAKWSAALWIISAIGDAAFKAGYFTTTIEMMEEAIQNFGGLGNLFVHLRLGQAFFEKNEMDKSADQLMRAYMGAGENGFKNEDPKYLKFLKTRAIID